MEVKLKCINIFFLLLVLRIFVFSQESDHQRIGIEKTLEHSISPSFDLNIYQIKEKNEFYLNPSIGIDYLLGNKFLFSTSLPSTLYFSGLKERRRRFAISDPYIAIGYYHRINDFRINSKLSYSFPLGIYDYYEINGKLISSSSGYHKPGFGISISKIEDPIIINVGLNYSFELLKKERFGYSNTLGKIVLNMSFTEVLNDRFGYRVNLQNILLLPNMKYEAYQRSITDHILTTDFGIFYSLERINFEIGVSKDLTSNTSLPLLSINTSYSFDF